ncbi:MAG: hypothetical protein ACP5GH_06945 [Nitrososphaeria archaeon]
MERKRKAALGSTEKRIYSWMFFHPGSSLKECASALRLSYPAVKMAWHRLRRSHNLARLCPLCFNETLYDGVCHTCGFEAEEDLGLWIGPSRSSEAVHSLLPGNGLGTETDYSALKLNYGALNIKHIVEHAPETDRTYESLREKLLEILKGLMLSDEYTELAARILRSEYSRWRRLYPDMISKKGWTKAMIRAVVLQLSAYLPPSQRKALLNSVKVMLNEG